MAITRINYTTDIDLGTNSLFIGGSTSANALDDYEEGTASVYLRVEGRGDSSVSGTNTSSYTKIGNRVFVRFRMNITGVTGADSGRAMEIVGLPFTVTSTADSTGSARIGVLGSSVTGYQVILFSNGTLGRIEEWTGTTGTNMSDHFQNTSSVLLELSYETTA